jgi:biotin carboxylase
MSSTTTPSLLLLGAEPNITRACLELGVDLVVAYGPTVRDADALDVPEQVRTVFVQDQRTPEAVLSALHRAGLADRHYDAVLTVYEHALVHASVLARLLGARGIPPEIAVRFRDKWLQKQAISGAGLRTARSALIEDIAYPDELPELDTWPRVFKPAFGVGTQLTTVVQDQAGLREAAVRFYRSAPRNRTYVAEEFSRGEEWSADGVVFRGEVAFLSVATYEEPCLAMLDRNAPITYRRFDPEADADVFRLADPFVRGCIAALGLTEGVFHMELFHDRETGELTFGECAARRGAALVGEEVRFKFNVDLGEEAVRVALGWAPRLDVKVSPDSIGNTHLHGPPGVLLSAPTPAEVLAQEGVRYAAVEQPVGSVISASHTSAEERVGIAVLAAPGPDALYRRMGELRDWFASRLIVAPQDVPLRTLRAWHRRTWPDVNLDDAKYEEAEPR